MTISLDSPARPGSTNDRTPAAGAQGTLKWGRSYATVSPDHFRVAYAINPFMDVTDQPNPLLARRQWDTMVAVLGSLGARVDVLPQRLDSPDMVYAMNLGFALRDGQDQRLVMSHMRFAQRRHEGLSAAPWFDRHGYRTSWVGADGFGAFFEAGDAFPFGDALVVGYGKRTDELGLKAVATELGVRVRGLRIVHPAMYHLDLAFCPLSTTQALVCTDALDKESAAAVLDLVPDPLVLSEQEALTFCANSVVVGRTVVMPACPPRVRTQLEAWGFDIVIVDVSEFHKGGGSIRCLTNPTDITLRRDLPSVLGGEVVVPI
ncbi:MAG: arginine deiminase family protein [Actinomycetota bacterium]|nr:arginine deiminase family protein [Actinomycetota bacterium]